jgi:hypothetical protein
LNAEIILIFEKYLMPFRLFSVSLINGSRYRSFTETLLIARKSIYNRSPLPGFFTNRTSEAIGEELGRIKPFSKFSISYSRSVLSSSRDIEYRGPNGRSFPGSSFIS